jgi:branched-subunit amino acid aminotransferase/4-amino-4-deoxychorismate lyase
MAEFFFIYNNKFYPANTPVISSGNRSLRYGDGLFETMKMVTGVIVNKDYHFERLFNGLSLLQFDIPTNFNPAFLEKKINELVKKNKHVALARIRLMIFRGNGGIFDPEDHSPNFIIETWALNNSIGLNEHGLTVDIFPGAKKSCDSFSNLKSNNYLPYVMAGLFAKKNQLNDCILLNSFNRVCDSAIANVFVIKKNKIYTPPLTEGCVAGVMRRWMLEKFQLKKYEVIERNLAVNDILDADEFFLTNSIFNMRWVRSFRGKKFGSTRSKEIYAHILQTI